MMTVVVMALADDIRTLRDRVLGEFATAYDYYLDTLLAWNLAEELIGSGREFTVTNAVTGTQTTHADLVNKSAGYVALQLPEATFQQFIAIFESFFFDFLRLWLTAYPQSLGKKMIDFKAILDAPDKDAITQAVVTKELIEVLYDRPAEWFNYLNSKAKLGCPTDDEIAQLAEAKASRDVIIHNRGIVNDVYLSKAGPRKRFELGKRLEITEAYHRQTWNLFRKIVADLCDAALAKSV